MKYLLLFIFVIMTASCSEGEISLKLINNTEIAFTDEDGFWRAAIISDDGIEISRLSPIRIELFYDDTTLTTYYDYEVISENDGIVTAEAEITLDSVRIEVVDVWSIKNGSLQMLRKLHVAGDSERVLM